MKKIICILLTLTLCAGLFAFSKDNTSVETMYQDVESFMKHRLEKYEQDIINTTYLYYYKQCKGNWTKTVWDTAVSKSVKFCNNKAAVATAKAGNFGEKFLQALIVTGEDAWKGFNNWVERKSEEYGNRR